MTDEETLAMVAGILGEPATAPPGTSTKRTVTATPTSPTPSTSETYEPHPIADCWPLVEGPEFTALCESVRAHGLLQPITLYERKVLDGRNRLRACIATGVTPKFFEYKGDDPLGFSLAQNDARRHLDASQRAMVGARIATLPKGLRPDASGDASAMTQTEAADLMHVGRAQVQRARVVQEQAVPELVAAVDSGRITVAAASKLVEEPAEDQRAIAAKLAEGKSARTAIREVKPSIQKGASDVEATPNRAESVTVQEVYAAYETLSLVDQEKLFGMLKARWARAATLKAAADDAVSAEHFREGVLLANRPRG